ncbi:MAG: molybdopterin oxidoreductase [Acidimicrobiales bacterium]
MRESRPRFLQGVHPFKGLGLDKPFPIDLALTYVVPQGWEAQAVYFRAGNSSDELVIVMLVRDGVPMRLFPVGAKDSVHVSLRIVEDLTSDTCVEVQLAAPVSTSGWIVVDLGLMEV